MFKKNTKIKNLLNSNIFKTSTNIILIIALIIGIMILWTGIYYMYHIHQDNKMLSKEMYGAPTIAITYDETTKAINLQGDPLYYTNGVYRETNNHIRVSLTSSDFLDTLFHEYGHFIYRKQLTDKEKKYITYLCDDNYSVSEHYPKSMMCEEQFVRTYALYLKRITENNLSSFDEFTEVKTFYQVLTEKYLGGKTRLRVIV